MPLEPGQRHQHGIPSGPAASVASSLNDHRTNRAAGFDVLLIEGRQDV
jgi:hypothetical protein